jgi:hypothetical protein
VRQLRRVPARLADAAGVVHREAAWKVPVIISTG